MGVGEAILVTAMFIGFGSLMLFAALTWFGIPPRENPELSRSNAYAIYLYIFPIVMLFAGIFVLSFLGDRIDAPWFENLSAAIGLVMFLAVPVGFVTFVFQPRWARPRWQRRMLDNKEGRQALRKQAVFSGHTHLVFLLLDGDEEPGTTAADHHDARQQAARLLDERSDVDGAVIVAVRGHRRIDYLDRADRPAVREPG